MLFTSSKKYRNSFALKSLQNLSLHSEVAKAFPKGICIFSYVCWQIIGEVKRSLKHVNFWINHCKKKLKLNFYTLSEQNCLSRTGILEHCTHNPCVFSKFFFP